MDKHKKQEKNLKEIDTVVIFFFHQSSILLLNKFKFFVFKNSEYNR